MAMISYAQNREDVLLARVFTDPTGFYIDVGASDPVVHSVTKWFYDRGWSGVNIEPHTPTFDRLAAARPRDVNLNIAVSEAEGTFEFFEIPHTDGLHTLEQAVAEKVLREGHAVLPRTVPCRTLVDVCAEHVGDRPIDFLKVDAEGHERAVLAGMDLTRWRPRVLVVEATEPCSTVPSHGEWEQLVLEAGYRLVFFDGLNRYYVRQDESEDFVSRLAVPASVFDAFTPYEQIAAVQKEEAATAAARAERDSAIAAAELLQREATALRHDRTDLQCRLSHTQELLSGAQSELVRLQGELTRALDEADIRLAELTAAAGREAELRVEVANLRKELAHLRATTVNRAALAAAMSILAATRAHLEKARGALLTDRIT